MKYAAKFAIYAFLVAGLSGCANTTPTTTAAPPTTNPTLGTSAANITSDTPTTALSTPDPVTPSPSPAAPVVPAAVGNAVFHFTTDEGYKASFSLSMSGPVSIETTAVSNDCRSLATGLAPIDTSPVALKAITIVAKMDYTPVDGFSWPVARKFSVHVTGSKRTSAVCSSPTSDGALDFNLPSPSDGTASYTTQIIYGAAKTPKNPTGEASASGIGFSLSLPIGETCDVTGLPNTNTSMYPTECGVDYPN